MINLDLYPRFKSDIDSPHINIYYILIIGWDKEDFSVTDIGSPSENAIYVSQRKENFDGNYYEDYDLKVPTINEVQDFKDNKYRINNLNLKLSNFEVGGTRFSDLLESSSFYNTSCMLFYKSQTCETLNDCLPSYLGLIRKIKHSDKSVSISIEDFAEHHFDLLVPKSKMVATSNIPDRYKNKAIPMTYGRVDKVPIPFSVGQENDLNSNLTLYIDSQPYNLNSAFQSTGQAVGSDIVAQDPVFIYDESYFNVIKQPNLDLDPLENYNYFYATGGNNAPRIVFGTYSYEDPEVNINDESDSQYINDTSEGWLRLQVFKNPTSLGPETFYRNSDGRWAGHGVNSYPSETAYLEDTPDNEVKWDRGYDDIDSFVQIDHHMESVSWAGQNYQSTQFLAQFENTSLPFGDDVIGDPARSYVLIKAKSSMGIACLTEAWHSGNISYNIEYNWNSGDGLVAQNGGGHNFNWNYSNADPSGNGHLIISPHHTTTHLWAENNWYTNQSYQGGENINGIWIHKPPENSSVDLAGQDEAGSTELLRGGTLEGRWRNVTYDNISSNAPDGARDFYVGENINSLRIGYGSYCWTDHLYGSWTNPTHFEPSGYTFWWHHLVWLAKIRLYDLKLIQNLTVQNMHNREYYVNISSGRNTMGGVVGYTKDILQKELEFTNNEFTMPQFSESSEVPDEVLKWLSFSAVEPIPVKTIINELCKISQVSTKYKNDGKFSWTVRKKKYNEDDVTAKILEKEIIKYSFSKTSIEDLKTKMKLEYNYDFALDEYKANIELDIYNLLSLDPNNDNFYDLNYYNLSSLDYLGQETHSKSYKSLESKYITSKVLWETKRPPLITQNDGYATYFTRWKLLDLCQQKLIIEMELPLYYIYLETGDVVSIDSLIKNLKAYGRDYTTLERINGVWFYPAFIISKITKSEKSVKIKMIQLTCVDPDVYDENSTFYGNHNWYNDPVEQPLIPVCTTTGAINQYTGDMTGYVPNDAYCWWVGDPNNDGQVNVIDIVLTVQQILYVQNVFIDNLSPNYMKAMDINHNGVINVVDIILMVNMIIHAGDIDEEVEAFGCTNPQATNYNPNAVTDDGSCILPVNICGYPASMNYDPINDIDYVLQEEQVYDE